MERVFKKICKAYNLGELREYTKLEGGTTADAWKLTANGYFFVRTLRDKAQGELELAVNIHLVKQDFYHMAVVFDTEDDEPALEVGGVWYQVQNFVLGTRPNPDLPGVAGAVARTVKELVSALSDCPPVRGDDRFALAEAWQQGKEYWPLLKTEWTPEQAEEMVSRCCGIAERDVQVIHGDLGLWNMIADRQGRISVIDFGEVRMGDPYFDYASALGSVINHTPEDRRIAVCREFLAELNADRTRLLEQLRLWVWRGLAQWAILAGKGVPGARMAARFINALKWAEEHLYEL